MTLRSRLGRNRWGSEAGRKTRMLRPDDGSWQRSGNGRCCGRAQVVKGRQGLMRDAMAAGRAVKWFVNGGISFASWCVRGSCRADGQGWCKTVGDGSCLVSVVRHCSQAVCAARTRDSGGGAFSSFGPAWPGASSLQPQQCQHKAGWVHTPAPSTCPCQSHRGACHRHKSSLPYTHAPRSHQQKLDETERAFQMRADDGEGRA